MILDQDPKRLRFQFSCLPGSREIVSEFALLTLFNLYRDARPARVLEVGSGIGTITAMLALWKPFKTEITAIEDHAWCQDQARANLQSLTSPLLFFYDKLPLHGTYDFVVVDGPQVAMRDLAPALAPQALVTFEGNRRGQRAELEQVLRNTGRPFARVNLKPADRTKGLWVYKLNPSRAESVRFWKLSLIETCKDWAARLDGRPVGKRRGW